MVNIKSEHILFQQEDSDKLVIYFTDAAARNFAGYKLLQQYKVNRLFVKDNTRNWYNGPIEGLSEDIYDLVVTLKKFTSKFTPENIYCMGGSMGAYAAIVIGCLLGAKNILAFSPQMMLDTRFPNNPKNEKLLKEKDAFNIIKKYPQSNIHIFCGSEDLLDVYNCYPSNNFPNVELTCVYGAPHNSAGFLKKLGVLDSIISYYIDNKTVPEIVLPTMVFPNEKDWYEKLGDGIEYFYSKMYSKALDQFFSLLTDFPTWSPLYAYISECYIKLGDYPLALENIEKAILINESADSYYVKKGVILINLKKIEEAEDAFIKAKNVALVPLPLHDIKIGSIKAIKGEYEAAEEIFNKLYEKEPTNTQLLYQLGLLMNKKGSYKEAIEYFTKSLKLGDKNPNTLKHLKFSCIQQSREYYMQKKYNEAVNILGDFLNLNPNDVEVLKELTCNFVMSGNFDAAQDILKNM